MKKITLLFSLILCFQFLQAQETDAVNHFMKVDALYFNCGNVLRVYAEQYGVKAKDLDFKVEGARLIKGEKPELITLVPNGAKVTLAIYNGEKLLESINYRVRKVPYPEIDLSINSRKVNYRKGIAVGQLSGSLTVDAIPDAMFRNLLPQDANYQTRKCQVTLARGTTAVATITGTGTISVMSLGRHAKSGDRLIVEIKEVNRIDFEGRRERVKIGAQIYVIPLN